MFRRNSNRSNNGVISSMPFNDSPARDYLSSLPLSCTENHHEPHGVKMGLLFPAELHPFSSPLSPTLQGTLFYSVLILISVENSLASPFKISAVYMSAIPSHIFRGPGSRWSCATQSRRLSYGRTNRPPTVKCSAGSQTSDRGARRRFGS